MPAADKRARQKERRAARLEAERAQAKRARRLRLARNLGILVVVVFGIGALVSFLSSNGSDFESVDPDVAASTSDAAFRLQEPACDDVEIPPTRQAPVVPFDEVQPLILPGDTATATITTNCGEIAISLDTAAAGEEVSSFAFLTRTGYYDDTFIHRILGPSFFQGGDPSGIGNGTPGYTLPASDSAPLARGQLALATGDAPGSGGVWSIAVADGTSADSAAAIGTVTAGEDVIDTIAGVDVGLNADGESSRPMQSVWVESVTVEIEGTDDLLETSDALFRTQDAACDFTGIPAEPPVSQQFEAAEDEGIDPGATVTMTIVTNCGDIVLELDPGAAPETVNSMVFLARAGFYDNTFVHRVVPGFVMQGGDQTATGTEGPGYRLPEEFPTLTEDQQAEVDTIEEQAAAGEITPEERINRLNALWRDAGHYLRGQIAMASSAEGVSGSQWFVLFDDTPQLGYTLDGFNVFGRVIEGEEVLDLVEGIVVGLNGGGELSRPRQSVWVESITVEIG